MIVMKFGGSSVGQPEAMVAAADIIAGSRVAAGEIVVVVSALSGVTDQLLGLATAAKRGDEDGLSAGLAALAARHLEMADGLLGGEGAAEYGAFLTATLAEMERTLRGVAGLGELSGRSSDLIVSVGERLSAPLLAAVLRARGCSAAAVDARDCVVAEGAFGNAGADLVRTEAKARALIGPLAVDRVVIVTGFIARRPDGETVTLGRGGSDYSATILAHALGAAEVWIWKEVDGVLTADPKAVPEAALLSRVSYDEAAEMSFFGAKVLHPLTMAPVMEKGIPIRLRNTFAPDRPGTLIADSGVPTPHGVKVVSGRKGLALVTVAGKGMAGITGFAARVFETAGQLGVNILMISQASSEQSICLVTESRDAERFAVVLRERLKDELSMRAVQSVGVRDGVAAIAAVGEGMKGRPGTAAKVFAATGAAGVNILAIAQGSSELNISFIVDQKEMDRSLRALHAEFALDRLNVCAPAI